GRASESRSVTEVPHGAEVRSQKVAARLDRADSRAKAVADFGNQEPSAILLRLGSKAKMVVWRCLLLSGYCRGTDDHQCIAKTDLELPISRKREAEGRLQSVPPSLKELQGFGAFGPPNALRLSGGAQAEAAALCKISFPRRPKRCWAPAAPSAG